MLSCFASLKTEDLLADKCNLPSSFLGKWELLCDSRGYQHLSDWKNESCSTTNEHVKSIVLNFPVFELYKLDKLMFNFKIINY